MRICTLESVTFSKPEATTSSSSQIHRDLAFFFVVGLNKIVARDCCCDWWRHRVFDGASSLRPLTAAHLSLIPSPRSLPISPCHSSVGLQMGVDEGTTTFSESSTEIYRTVRNRTDRPLAKIKLKEGSSHDVNDVASRRNATNTFKMFVERTQESEEYTGQDFASFSGSPTGVSRHPPARAGPL